ncbi:MAG: hypothetical protein K6E71_09840 [Lachnospiraceae bacterium]|nr:hypothetical protein [Lachnospiraceae bacterium]
METKNGLRWLRRLKIFGIVLVILAMVYLGVHFVCCEAVMGPFLNGEKNGSWYVTTDGLYEVSARRFGLMEFYGEVHVERVGSRKVIIGGGAEQKPSCGLIVWRGVGFVEYGLMITTVPDGKRIVYYMVTIDENGEYVPDGTIVGEKEEFVKKYIEENKEEIMNMIGKYHSIGG